ncbi:Phosphate:acyl-ACP acyltransferase PlsX [Liberibacter crescens BT-1]|uniref:Phosphate acyltransferase n=1 Tax=Liberibacter crescens (strain BT-1) TaxID=1215343 RepID=L0EVD3_LIBCB|nr:phosphate acyltransferase PlsX [Liberibacter crescens]AGA64356.1 Phosphate:acyl-ACP acyltransferase PlsX [Liberibacter crescens BT-1]
MNNSVNIALDLMGGDLGPNIIILGAVKCLEIYPEINFLMYGDENVCRPLLEAHTQLKNKSSFYHCDVSISMDEKPSSALRRGRNVSSMWCAMESVKANNAAAMVSLGNTGALIAMARLCLNKIDNIDRPALAAFWPTLKGKSIILDVGASVGAKSFQLVQLAIIGSALARVLLKIEQPVIGLLNMGIEETKGYDELREAGRILREESIDSFKYYGFIEANNIFHGLVDVVVTEGFSGNIAIKSAEGTGNQISRALHKALQNTILTRIGYLLVRKAFKDIQKQFDPRKFNGGLLLGLDGLIVKGHGSSDSVAVVNAINIAYNISCNRFIDQIKSDLSKSAPTISKIKGKEETLRNRK